MHLNTAGCIAVAYPMHGQHKLSNEGYRTRDGHIIEWLGTLAVEENSHIAVVSRPEPRLLAPLRRIRGTVARGTAPTQTLTWRIPDPRDPKRWWVHSASAYPELAVADDTPAVVWNPLVANSPNGRTPFGGGRTVVLDLLDDWTISHNFRSIRDEVEAAYRKAFESSATVFANSEGTVELAHRFGRDDVILMPNGVDPERFTTVPNAQGPLRVGYVGKIGNRLDYDLISQVCGAFPKLRFIFAGPFIDSQGRFGRQSRDKFRTLLTSLPNVEVLGDVHYEHVPALMASFDLGWVPHSVGKDEVGGDAIKTYEYRATGLQVLTTPVIGAGRTLRKGVHIVPAKDQVAWLEEATRGRVRLDRVTPDIPDELTWRYKAFRIAECLDNRFST